ncbi:glutathione S-transferase family protein [Pseudahrensia aquimaris]|uniref:Glutathione S-transferase family protein n=1 Tax=Pseudahrensia aquimaris TaxID=744461 RepID=A0ABW3FAR7_9HYPH
MLKLLTFAPCLGTRSPSPFAVKGEALLAMSGLDYTTEVSDVRKAPRGKLPVLDDGGTLIPDTAHIQTHLEQVHNIDFDSHLSDLQRAHATAFRRLIEDHFYYLNAHYRWADHPQAVRDGYFADAPKLLRGIIFKVVNRNITKMLHMTGLSRHTREQMEAMTQDDVDALATQLGDQRYFMGDKISSIDASLFGALEGLIPCTLDTPSGRMVKAHANLVAYHERLSRELFG